MKEKRKESESEEEEGEGDEVRVGSSPRAPTQEEWEEHMASHIPYRSSCPSCVAGRGRRAPRRRSARQEGEVAVVSMDYGYCSGRHGKIMDGEESDEDEDGEMAILVMKDGTPDKGQSGRIRAIPIPRKGAHPFAVHEVEQELKRLGYKEVRVRTDQEKAIIKLKEALDLTGKRVMLEESAVQRHEGRAVCVV